VETILYLWRLPISLIQISFQPPNGFPSIEQSNSCSRDGDGSAVALFATTFPSGEKWEWKAYKKEQGAGDVILQLENLSWNNKIPVLFVFK
jgi:hypothetical protein